ncbi:MAG: N-acetyl sugar amidotransferase [Promethearchaeota archaeon]
MRRCKRCVITDTRPGIRFDEEGICEPCRYYEDRNKIDWNKRWAELEELCNKHRRDDGYYDCIIPVSGGKDSMYQVGLFKEKLNMNPLCLMVNNLSWTETGRYNFNNLSERFGVDILQLTLNRKASRILALKGFEEELKPNKYWDRALYVWPLQMALKLDIKLVIWGENTNYETGGPIKGETPDALIQLKNGIISPEPLESWCVDGITMKDLQPCIIPPLEQLESLDVIFTSYYVPWSRSYNVEYARKNGFKTLYDTQEWVREGYREFEYEQIDTIGYLTNQYCKFIKFGFSSMTELCSQAIRDMDMTRKHAIRLVKEEDWKLDRKMLEDFCTLLGITEDYFWKIIDKFANREILEKRDGYWKLKECYLDF